MKKRSLSAKYSASRLSQIVVSLQHRFVSTVHYTLLRKEPFLM